MHGEMSRPVKPVKRVVTPRLRRVLYVVLTLFGILLASGLYLSSVTLLQFLTERVYENRFYQFVFLSHLGLGLLLIVPAVGFGLVHMMRARNRRNRRAVRVGYGLFAASLVILISGVLLMRVGSFAVVDPGWRRVIYWLHLIGPAAAIWLYIMHRLVGPRIKWAIGRRVAVVTVLLVAAMVGMQAIGGGRHHADAPEEGLAYFEPSKARTATGTFISAEALMNDQYCLECHPDTHHSWLNSAHHLSSFNNPAYRASVREARLVAAKRDGSVKATRWCAGCHDPVPFFSGEFDDPQYDDVHHPTAHAGITCTACHAIQSIGSTTGNGDYVIDEPVHYPFTYSKNPLLKSLNHLMVKAKPAFHKHEMLKPFHKTADFCSVCHKVNLVKEVTGYKEFLRGQNHHDSFLLSGVSGHGARSFYYPEHAHADCNDCHMAKMPSSDFGAAHDRDLGELAIRDHQFLGANTALPHWFGDSVAVERQQRFLKDSLRIDLFGLREEGRIDGRLIAPLRPQNPTLEKGETYLLETVLRTLKVGHHFTQGTTDSNEIWVEIVMRSGDQVIGSSGRIGPDGAVDRWSHFVNTFMLDREGRRINRRNAQDIFTPLYSNQIPPGAGQTIHYRFTVPETAGSTVEVTAKLRYRKFDQEYIEYIRADRGAEDVPLPAGLGAAGTPTDIPITTIAEDSLTFAVAGNDPVDNPPRDIPAWQRWNDYGIGLLLKGKAELRQAAAAFREVERLGRYDGPLNLARAQFVEGDLAGATESLGRAAKFDPPPPPWTHAWLSGVVDRQQGNLQQAADSLRGVLQTRVPERGFDFSYDYVVRNELGMTLLDLAQQADAMGREEAYRQRLAEARDEFLKVLTVDAENVTAHASLAEVYAQLGDPSQAEAHRKQHAIYKPDDNAKELAVPKARKRYPAADHAAEALVIYDLQRSQGASQNDLTGPPPR